MTDPSKPDSKSQSRHEIRQEAKSGTKSAANPASAAADAPNSETFENTDALVGIVMGSSSDFETLKHTHEILVRAKVPCEVKVVSAHRTPERMFNYGRLAISRGLKVIIAGAGGAAHLPGMLSALTTIPVLGVPVASNQLNGVDSLLSIVQMPAGVPTATFAIGRAGAVNAALFAIEILSLSDKHLAKWLVEEREKRAAEALAAFHTLKAGG